jgi:FkbM family methyltransferase
MITKYEGALFDIELSDTYQFNLFKQSLYNPIKKIIGPFVGKPYKQDEVLSSVFAIEKKNPIIIDIGCHIGTISVPAAKKFPDARFISLDAYPLPLAKLIKNIKLNGLKNIQVINAAIAEQNTLLTIYPCSGNAGGARVTGFKGRPEEFDGGGVLVPSISIKDIFSFYNLTHCDFLKIDVEGYELAALKSAHEYLYPNIVHKVVAEYGPEGCRSAGITGWDLVNYMKARGYGCIDLSSNKIITNLHDIPTLEDYHVTNFLFFC